jgi:hypothetical protein
MRNAKLHADAFERAGGRIWCDRREDALLRSLRRSKTATEHLDG